MTATPVSSSEVMGFGSLDIHFDDSVLRPRPWTNAQSMWADELLIDAPDGAVLELCSGVGHMGIMLASLVSRNVVLVDIDVTFGLIRDYCRRTQQSLSVVAMAIIDESLHISYFVKCHHESYRLADFPVGLEAGLK